MSWFLKNTWRPLFRWTEYLARSLRLCLEVCWISHSRVWNFKRGECESDQTQDCVWKRRYIRSPSMEILVHSRLIACSCHFYERDITKTQYWPGRYLIAWRRRKHEWKACNFWMRIVWGYQTTYTGTGNALINTIYSMCRRCSYLGEYITYTHHYL